MSTWTGDDAKRFARQGWDRSLERLATAWGESDAEACMVALYEALTWARALDESLGETRPGRPEILKAVKFARDRALHSLVRLLKPRGGYAKGYLLGYQVLAWVHLDEIDRPARKHVDQHGMRAFEHYFQTKAVLDTMREVDGALT